MAAEKARGPGGRIAVSPAEGGGAGVDPVIQGVQIAAAFVRAHLREPLTLEDLADVAGYSPFHLARAFTTTVGTPPIRYLAALRFHAAKRLLLTEGLGVVDVCHEVGFSSPGTFTRRFRGQVGVAPGELRRVADDVAETTATPFRLAPPGAEDLVRVRVHVPAGAGRDPLVWVGLFSAPAPAGVPGAGVLRRGPGDLALPVVPGFPWLLATMVPATADPVTQLADESPLVAVHPAPICAPTSVQLTFRPAHPWEMPILTALPALRKIGVS